MNTRLIPLLAAVASLTLGGCASVMNDPTQSLRIETKTADGRMVPGAECRLSTDAGTVTARSGETVPIRRSGADIDVVCRHGSNPEAGGRIVSRANAGFAGNIILGGGIGMIVDHKKGTAYTYPSWIQLVFGRTLVFDRSAERDGMPVPGLEVGRAQASR